jgi:hypothetical protein
MKTFRSRAYRLVRGTYGSQTIEIIRLARANGTPLRIAVARLAQTIRRRAIVVITVESPIDERGQQSFFCEWIDRYGVRRAQNFRGNLLSHIDGWEWRGYRAVVRKP